MFSQLKRLGADSLLYAFMNVGTKLIAFILFPLYAHYLDDTSQIGLLQLVDTNVSMLTFLVIFGTDSALAYYYFEYKDKETREKYVRSVMTFRLSMVILLFVVFLIGGEWLSSILLDSEGYSQLFYIALGTLCLDTIVTLVLTILRYEFHTKRVVATTVGKMLLIAIVSILFLMFVWTSLEGILLARLISVGIIVLVLIRPVRVYLRPLFDWNILKKILVYAAPLVPASLAFWIIANANNYFLTAYATISDVGIYGTAIKFATFITLLTSGIQLAWRPFSMSLKDKESSPKLFSTLYAAFLLIGSLGVLLLATAMPWIIMVMPEKFRIAFQYVAPISIATFLSFYYMIVSTGIFYTKQTKHISIAFGIAAVVSLILNFIFVPIFSIWGTVISYVGSYCLALFIVFRKSQKLYYVPFSGFKMAWTIFWLIAATLSIVYVQLEDLNSWLIVGVWIVFIILILLVRMDKYFVNRK
ncbi:MULTISPECIES: oligosaccharide flippase family protein [Bacillaceae]|uniref:lipopolysaccharide biosynthesis protein n=1 Tax=Bacillaceae TaxID=186817 RepID=UPI000702398B|nr:MULTISPECIES: oligosaccharide flippase family protein [Bacillaceae]KQL36781.1 polysaccharide biosynthesis protein [Psychrobacillus sp. FJAT-21963]MDF2065854.1 oligosaccharide flippase family protein [Bacillus sp. Cr_A10]